MSNKIILKKLACIFHARYIKILNNQNLIEKVMMQANKKTDSKKPSSKPLSKPSSKTSSATKTATKTATSTKTSTDAYTQGNITVTGGAGRGAATKVNIDVPRNGATKKKKAK